MPTPQQSQQKDPWGVAQVSPAPASGPSQAATAPAQVPIDPWGVKSVAPASGQAQFAPPTDADYANAAKLDASGPGTAGAVSNAGEPGFARSYADSLGLTGAGQAIVHPIDTARGVWNALSDDNIKNAIREKGDLLKQAWNDDWAGNHLQSLYHLTEAVPVLGSGMDRAASQLPATQLGEGYFSRLGDVLSSPGAMGTLAGTATALAPVGAGMLKLAGAGERLSSLASSVPAPIATPLNAVGRGAGVVADLPAKGLDLTRRATSAVLKPLFSTTDSLQLAGSRLLAPGTAGETLVRGLKPSVAHGPAGNIAASLEGQLPNALAQNPSIGSVADLGQAYDAARDATGKQFSNIMAPYEPGQGTFPRPLTIHGDSIAEAQNASIPAINLFEDWEKENGVAARTANTADTYRKPIGAWQADQMRQDANQKLAAFYNRQGGDQAAALSNPETARLKAVGDAIRDSLYPAVEKDQGLTSGSLSAIQKQYGQLIDAGDIANKRAMVFGRQQPVSLAEQIAVSHGGPLDTLFNYAKEHTLKSMTDSDALVRSAIDRYANPGGAYASLEPRSNNFAQKLFEPTVPTSVPAPVVSAGLAGLRYGAKQPTGWAALLNQKKSEN